MEGEAKQTSPQANNTNSRGPRTRPPRRRKQLSDNKNKQNIDNGLMVHVTGFASFTQEEDLKCIFSKNDVEVLVENMTKQIATLVYTTKRDADAAVEKSGKISLYGSFLTVKPFNPSDEPSHDTRNNKNFNRMEFPLTKQKGIIIDPKQIDLSGQFYEQLDNILASVRLNKEEVEKIGQLYEDLECVLQEAWPGCVALPFGSITTGLGMKTSDADCFIEVPSQFKMHYSHDYFIPRTKRLLQLHPDAFVEILCIPRANTPIVKFFHVPTETNCDVTFKTLLGVQNSKLIGFLLHADPRIIPVAVLIRYWAKVHELSGSGKLTNYALTLLIIFYLQQPPLSILPSVEWLQRDRSNDIFVDYWNTGFMQDYNCLPPPSTNVASISELIGGFFQFYSMFNFEDTVICPYLGTPLKKDVFKDIDSLPQEFALYSQNISNRLVFPIKFTTSICIQDPLEQNHNVASGVNSRLATQLNAFFKYAANAFEKDKVNHHSEFLKIILLMKPKIPRVKNHSEFRVNLLPKLMANISNPEWKADVREALMTIFEKILKIKLGKMEEKMTPNAGKEKEKYVGATARAVWKRKQFSKIYSHVKMGFVEKETRITDEILKSDKQPIQFQFNLTVTYCHEPRSAVITVKMVTGSQDTFREFGKFFNTVLPEWFMKLMNALAKEEGKFKKDSADVADTLEDDLDAINIMNADE